MCTDPAIARAHHAPRGMVQVGLRHIARRQRSHQTVAGMTPPPRPADGHFLGKILQNTRGGPGNGGENIRVRNKKKVKMIRPFLFGLTLSYLAIDNILDGPFREFLATYFDLKAFGTNTREEYLYYLLLFLGLFQIIVSIKEALSSPSLNEEE